MIDPEEFLNTLIDLDIRFFTGVPDSLLKEICLCLNKFVDKKKHIIACNEGAAVGLGIGHYLATSRPALIYLQNSGLGNTINPLISLSHKKIYSIPAILLVGWRAELLEGSSQIEDEPQHRAQGSVTCKQLELMDIDYIILDKDTKDYKKLIEEYLEKSLKMNTPFAIVVRKNTFKKSKENTLVKSNSYLPKRENIIENIIKLIPKNTFVVSTTGFTSRELFEIRESLDMNHSRDFLTIGGMGFASQIAAGIALSKPKFKILCLDGDGSLLMHNGVMAVNASCSNLIHVVINNGVHDSVGGQPTNAKNINLSQLASIFGYGYSIKVDNLYDLNKYIEEAFKKNKSYFIEVKSYKGSRLDLGRPNLSPIKIKELFMESLKKND